MIRFHWWSNWLAKRLSPRTMLYALLYTEERMCGKFTSYKDITLRDGIDYWKEQLEERLWHGRTPSNKRTS